MVNKATDTFARSPCRAGGGNSNTWNGFYKQKPVSVNQEDLQLIELMNSIQSIKGK